MSPWRELSVVEGEPQAAEPPAPEPPRFERGFYRLARDLDTGQETVSAGEQVFVACPVSADDTKVRACATRVRFSFRVSRAALAAAGAVRVE